MVTKKKKSVKKKSRKKTTPKRRVARRSVKRFVNKPQRVVKSNQKKVGLVIKNLLIFSVLFILSLGLYIVSSEEFYVNLFLLLSVLSGFVALAFILIFLVFVFMRFFKR